MGNKQNRAKRTLNKSNNWKGNIKMRKRKATKSIKGIHDVRKVHMLNKEGLAANTENTENEFVNRVHIENNDHLEINTANTENESFDSGKMLSESSPNPNLAIYHSGLWNADIGDMYENIVIDVNDHSGDQNFELDELNDYVDEVDNLNSNDERGAEEMVIEDTGVQSIEIDELIEYDDNDDNFDSNGEREAQVNAETAERGFEIASSIDELIKYDDMVDEDNVEYIDYNNQEMNEDLRRIDCGMTNFRNNCFFNSVLQILFHVPGFVDCAQGEIEHNNCVTCSIRETLRETQYSTQIAICPIVLYQVMRNKYMHLFNGKQQDAHEVLIKLMESLDDKKHTTSLMTKIFEGDMTSTIICSECGNNSSKSSVFRSIEIDIFGKSHVKDGLDNFFSVENIESVDCSFCKRKVNATKQLKISRASDYLVIQLKRFTINGKVNTEVGFEHQLDLTDYLATSNQELKYKLIGVINHEGVKKDAGHYTAVVSTTDGNFYEFNDSLVHQIPFRNVVRSRDVYILVYEISNPSVTHMIANIKSKISHHHNTKNNKIQILSNILITAGTENIENETFNNSNTRIEKDYHSNSTIRGSENVDTREKPIDENEINLSGKRIVDFDFVFKQLQELNKHPKSSRCNFSDMVPVKELKRGLRSIILFRCKICKYYQKVESCPQNDESIGINGSATLGMTSIGLGFYHLEEFCANVDIPCMSESTFGTENKKLQDNWWYLAKKSEMEALREEIRLAILAGDVDANGNALIIVVVDGSWGKRSYGKGFSSLSGCAVIIGLRTKRIIYYGVKNKYCHTCKLSYVKTCPPNDHPCNINYYGPSSGMESEILLEGFKSCEKSCARFAAFISDGDSSFYKEIRELRLYINPELIIEKYECVNHLFRNFRKAFKKLSGITKFKVACRKYITEAKGGKRINYSLAKSYSGRIAASVVHYNSGGHGNSTYQEFFNMNSERCLQLERKRQIKLAKNTKANQIKPRQRRIFQDNSKIVRHGEQCDPDISPRIFEIAKQRLLKDLDENKANRQMLETTTKGQKHNPKWKEMRRNIIDSLHFGRIINVKSPKSYKNLLDEILYKQSEFGNTAEKRHQDLYEATALSSFSAEYSDYDLVECGLIIDSEFGFLCTSRTRLYGNDSIDIVKCPVKAFKQSFETAVQARSITFWDKTTFAVSKKSNWYIEIQGQLHITQKPYAFLIVWLEEEVHKIVKVERDDQFWEEKIKEKLLYFFNEEMLKELVNSRRSRKMDLREYDPQSNTFI